MPILKKKNNNISPKPGPEFLTSPTSPDTRILCKNEFLCYELSYSEPESQVFLSQTPAGVQILKIMSPKTNWLICNARMKSEVR